MKIKKYIYILIAGFTCCLSQIGHAALSEATVDPKGRSIFPDSTNGTRSFEDILFFVKNLLFNILWVFVVGAFIYIGYLFVTARGKPEEFKKAWEHAIYVVVGIALFSAAWGIVSIIAGLDF